MGKDKKPTSNSALAEAYDENARVAKLAEEVEAHKYEVSWTGMCCGAMVMRDGSGDQCGLPYGHSLHVDSRADRAAKEAAAAPGPLAEIVERTFVYEAEMIEKGVIATALENTTSALYQRVRLADYTAADATLTVTLGVGSSGRLTLKTTVRAWKAVAL